MHRESKRDKNHLNREKKCLPDEALTVRGKDAFNTSREITGQGRTGRPGQEEEGLNKDSCPQQHRGVRKLRRGTRAACASEDRFLVTEPALLLLPMCSSPTIRLPNYKRLQRNQGLARVQGHMPQADTFLAMNW